MTAINVNTAGGSPAASHFFCLAKKKATKDNEVAE
jgi:hypothetical protein